MVVTITQSREPNDAWGTALVLVLILVSGAAGLFWAERESPRAPAGSVVEAVVR
jgi:hypothetical protein